MTALAAVVAGWLWGSDDAESDTPWWGWLLWIVALTSAVVAVVATVAKTGLLSQLAQLVKAWGDALAQGLSAVLSLVGLGD